MLDAALDLIADVLTWLVGVERAAEAVVRHGNGHGYRVLVLEEISGDLAEWVIRGGDEPPIIEADAGGQPIGYQGTT